jgi:hypothetical protein
MSYKDIAAISEKDAFRRPSLLCLIDIFTQLRDKMVRAKTDKPADDGAPKKVKFRNNFSINYLGTSDTYDTYAYVHFEREKRLFAGS